MYKLNDIVFIFLKYLPEGRIWNSKYDSKIYTLKNGETYGFVMHYIWYLFASLFRDLLVRMDQMYSELSLSQLEETLGLPDSCIPIGETYDQRLLHVEIKQYLKKKCKNRSDFLYIGNLLGFDDMNILNGSEYNMYPEYYVPFYPMPEDSGSRDNIILVESDKIFDGIGSIPPQDVPFTPRQKTLNFKILECILNKYKPSYTKIIFIRKRNGS